MIVKEDRRNHASAVERRAIRERTTAIVIHHLAVDINRDGVVTVDDAIDFFTKDPEGIATVTLPGTYDHKLPTIARWKAKGPPFTTIAGVDLTRSGFVPYHFLIDGTGKVFRMLDLAAIGAHAGAWNDCSVGVAFLGDFSKAAPNGLEFDAGVALVEDILAVHKRAEILSHDETIQRDGGQPKGCPGKFFPLNAFRSRIRMPQ